MVRRGLLWLLLLSSGAWTGQRATAQAGTQTGTQAGPQQSGAPAAGAAAASPSAASPAVASPVTGDAAAGAFSYEVATVRLNTSGTGSSSTHSNNDSYRTENTPLRFLLQNAFHLQRPDQLLGLPGWATDARYDLNAKMDPDTMARYKALKPEERGKVREALLLDLLTDRFSLRYHREQREQPIYNLVLAKGGSKLKPADLSSPRAGSMTVNNTHMEVYGQPVGQLASMLAGSVGRTVVDRTGLAGKYDYTLNWSRDDPAAASADGQTERAPELMTAIQEQLGLKLEAARAPVEVIVIDSITQPEAN